MFTFLKGYQTAANQAMYGLPLWKYLPVCLSGVFTRLVEHKDTLFYTIGRLVDESLNQNNMESIDENSILGQLLKNHSLPLQEVKVSCVDYITGNYIVPMYLNIFCILKINICTLTGESFRHILGGVKK